MGFYFGKNAPPLLIPTGDEGLCSSKWSSAFFGARFHLGLRTFLLSRIQRDDPIMGIITEDKTPSRTDGGAFFVFSPRNADDFNQPFPLDKIQPYRIIGCIALNGMDYENFVTDMLVEREYLEPFEELCRTGAVYECVLVCRQGNNRTGILVIPDSGGYIKCAACYDYREVSEDEVQV